jgi:outer membrane protein TolC
VAPPPPASLPTPLTLPEAVAIALAHQPQRYIAADQTTSALGNRQEAKSEYFPSVVPTYQYQDSSSAIFHEPSQVVPIGGGGTTTITPNEVNITRGGGLNVAIDQSIFDSGQRELTNAEARHTLDTAELGEQTSQQQIILTVTQDYYSLLEDEDQIKVAQAQIDRFQQTLDQTKAEIAAGASAPNDVYQSEADLASAQVTLVQARSTARNADAQLKNDLGVPITGPVELASLASGTDLPPLPQESATGKIDDCVQTAYVHRPDLLAAHNAVENGNAAVKQAEIAAGLSIGATGSVSYQATNDLGNRGVDTQILFTGTYPLFDAGKERGAVREAQASRDQAVNQYDLTRLTVEEEVEQAYSTRSSAYDAAQLAQTAVTASQVNYNSALAGLKEGVNTILDVTTAQATLTQSEGQYVQAVYAYYSADAALQHAMGVIEVPTSGPEPAGPAPAGSGVPVTGGPTPPAVPAVPAVGGAAGAAGSPTAPAPQTPQAGPAP